MKIKLYLTAVLLTTLQWGNAQKKVGIGTETPQETLDVNGTMGIRKLGPAKKNDILAWDKTSKKVVVTPSSNEKFPFYYVNVFIPVAIPNQSGVPQGVNVSNLPIRINPENYDVTVVSVNLINVSNGQNTISNVRDYYESSTKSDYSVNYPIIGGNTNNNSLNLYPIIVRSNPNDRVYTNSIAGRVLVDVNKDDATTEGNLLLPENTYLLNIQHPDIKLEKAKDIRMTPPSFEYPDDGPPRYVPGKEIWNGKYKKYYHLSISYPNISEKHGRGFMPWAKNATNYDEQQDNKSERYAWIVTLFVMDNKWIKE